MKAIQEFNSEFIKQGKGLVLVVWLIVVLYFITAVTLATPENSVGLILRFISCLPGLLSALFLWRISNIIVNRLSRIQWQMICAGSLLWVISDYYRVFYTLIEGSHPTVNAWLNWINIAGFLLIAGGCLFTQILFRQRIIRLKMLLDLTISTGAMMLLGWLIFVFPAAESEVTSSIITRWQLVYPVLDIGIIALLINMILLIRTVVLRKTLSWFLLGVIGLTISDLAPASLTVSQAYLPGSGLDIGLLVGYSLIFTGVYGAYKSQGPLEEDIESGFEWTVGRKIQGILPLAMILVLVAELIIIWQNSLDFPQITLGITAMLWLLLIARQGVAAGEFELRQYAILFQNTAEPSFIADRMLKLVLVNPAMIRLCGFQSEGELLGRDVKGIFGDPGIPEQIDANWTSEVRLNLSNSIYLPVELSLNKISLDSPRSQRVIGTAHDLTPQKEQQAAMLMANQRLFELQSQLEKLNEGLEQRVLEKTDSLRSAYIQLEEQHKKLQSLDQLKSDFVSMVSHELRAPLTNISGGIEMLLAARELMSSKTRTSLALVQAEIQRLTQFVETILDLSALEAERLPVFPEPIDVNDRIQKTIRKFSDLPGSDRLETNLEETLPPVMADSRGLTSVLFHLIDNAIKYAPIGKILVSSERNGDNIQVRIRDHGPGIPEDIQPYVFEKFYRVNPVDSQRVYGHGLGLYMAERLITAMNGKIRVENCMDGGSMFSFWLSAVKE
jgi:signal transduction histidine kinase